MVTNVTNPQAPNDKDVRPAIIMQELQRIIETFGRENWNTLEIATLSMKVMETLVMHCKENKLDIPKSLVVQLADHSGEIQYKFTNVIPKRFQLPN